MGAKLGFILFFSERPYCEPGRGTGLFLGKDSRFLAALKLGGEQGQGGGPGGGSNGREKLLHLWAHREASP